MKEKRISNDRLKRAAMRIALGGSTYSQEAERLGVSTDYLMRKTLTIMCQIRLELAKARMR
jgi:hypothetical protein